MAGDQVGARVVLLIVIFIGVAIIWAIYANAQERARQRKQRLEMIQREAEGFLRRVEQEKVLPSTSVHIVLQKGEIGVLQETSTLSEARSYRVYAGGGTRIKGVYIGGGTSESHQRLTQIDSGSLVLTNQRLVFDGRLENRTVKVKDIVSVEPYSDAIEIGSSRRQKSQVYAVGNPVIWTAAIRLLASGEVTVGSQQPGGALANATAKAELKLTEGNSLPLGAASPTWRVFVPIAASVRRDVLREIIQEINPQFHPATLESLLNSKEITIASGLSLSAANALMIRLDDQGVLAEKQQDGKP